MNELLKDAVSMGSVDDVIDLLNKGVNPDQKYENGFRPLHFAASVNQRKCLTLLLDSGANINSLDDNGNTPLHIAYVFILVYLISNIECFTNSFIDVKEGLSIV